MSSELTLITVELDLGSEGPGSLDRMSTRILVSQLKNLIVKGSSVVSTAGLVEDPSSVPSTQMAAHDFL